MKSFLDTSDRTAVLDYLLARSAVLPDVDGGCWEWVGAKTRSGYGTFKAHGTQYYTHREAYKATGRRIAEGFQIDHLCQNKSCCNPAHLEAVSHEENTRRAKNRYWVAFMTENRAALNVSRRLGGSVIEPAEVER